MFGYDETYTIGIVLDGKQVEPVTAQVGAAIARLGAIADGVTATVARSVLGIGALGVGLAGAGIVSALTHGAKADIKLGGINTQKAEAAEERARDLREQANAAGRAARHGANGENAQELKDIADQKARIAEASEKEAQYMRGVAEKTNLAAKAFEAYDRSSQNAMASLGRGVNTLILPIVMKLTSAFDYLARSGVLENIGRKFAEAFDGDKITSGLLRGLALIIATVERIPEIVKGAFKIVADVFKVVRDHAAGIAAVLGALFLTSTIRSIVGAIMTVVKAYEAFAFAIKAVGIAELVLEAIMTKGASIAINAAVITAATAAGVAIWKTIDAMLPKGIGGMIDGLGGDDLNKRAAEIFSGMTSPDKAGPYGYGASMGAVAGTGEQPKPLETENNRYLKAIEKHTGKMVERLEDALLGGGAATDRAVNARNLNTWSGGAHGPHMRKIMEGFEGLFQSYGVEMARSGFVRRGA